MCEMIGLDNAQMFKEFNLKSVLFSKKTSKTFLVFLTYDNGNKETLNLRENGIYKSSLKKYITKIYNSLQGNLNMKYDINTCIYRDEVVDILESLIGLRKNIEIEREEKFNEELNDLLINVDKCISILSRYEED